MEEIKVKSNIDSFLKISEDPTRSESSSDLIFQKRKENNLSVLNNNIVEENSKIIQFNKLENNDKEETLSKSKIVYPTNLYSSLSFNWLYDVILKRTEENPVKLSSLEEISPEVQSKHFFDEIMTQWYGKYNKRVKSKKTGYPLFMTLLSTNKRRIVISFIIFSIPLSHYFIKKMLRLNFR